MSKKQDYYLPIRFVIFTSARTGSSLITHCLNQHSKIQAFGEKIDAIGRENPQLQNQWLHEFMTVHNKFVNFTESFLYKTNAGGFKVQLNHIGDLDNFTATLHKYKPKIITSYRDNIIKTAVSYINAKVVLKEHNRANIYKGEEPPPARFIEEDEFMEVFEFCKANRTRMLRYVDGLNLPNLHVCYEDLLEDITGTINNTFDFLEQERETFKIEMKKSTSDHLSDFVLNYEELRALFKETEYYEMW